MWMVLAHTSVSTDREHFGGDHAVKEFQEYVAGKKLGLSTASISL